MSDLLELLINEIKVKGLIHKFTSNRNEIAIRCPFCGDSIKSNDSTHLYIKLNNDENEPTPYYCQRCEAQGILTPKFLHKTELYNHDLVVLIRQINKKASKNSKIRDKYFTSHIKYDIPVFSDYGPNLQKLDYINKRLGTNITLQNARDYKIIVSLYEFLDHNNITFLNLKDKRFGDQLDNNAIGFLSIDNSLINFRSIRKDFLQKTRYYLYNIKGNILGRRFYSLPNKINLLNPELNLYLTEGVFDILSVFFNIRKMENNEKLYIACMGKGFKNICYYFIREGFLSLNLSIYSDSDVNINFYRKLKESLNPFINKISIYYNEKNNGNKKTDFGVTLKDIEIKDRILI